MAALARGGGTVASMNTSLHGGHWVPPRCHWYTNTPAIVSDYGPDISLRNFLANALHYETNRRGRARL